MIWRVESREENWDGEKRGRIYVGVPERRGERCVKGAVKTWVIGRAIKRDIWRSGLAWWRGIE